MEVSCPVTFWPFLRSNIFDPTFCFATLCNNLRVLIFSDLRNHTLIIVYNDNNNNNINNKHTLHFVTPYS
jgi:hypothetical protein